MPKAHIVSLDVFMQGEYASKVLIFFKTTEFSDVQILQTSVSQKLVSVSWS